MCSHFVQSDNICPDATRHKKPELLLETGGFQKWLTQMYWSISSLCIAAVQLDLEKRGELNLKAVLKCVGYDSIFFSLKWPVSKLSAFKSDRRKCIGPSHLCALLQSNWILKRLLKRSELNLHKFSSVLDMTQFFSLKWPVSKLALPKWLTQIYWSISSLCIAAVKLDLEKTFEARRTKS